MYNTSSSEKSNENKLKIKFSVYAHAKWDDDWQEFVVGDVDIYISNRDELTGDIIEKAMDYIEDHVKVSIEGDSTDSRYSHPRIKTEGKLVRDEFVRYKRYEPQSHLMGHMWW